MTHDEAVKEICSIDWTAWDREALVEEAFERIGFRQMEERIAELEDCLGVLLKQDRERAEKAEAAVLALRTAMKNQVVGPDEIDHLYKALADTELFEQYR